jgi:transcriptional regulator with XRE-family HTH domain
VRLAVRPDHDDQAAVVRRHGPRQPHTDAAVAAVRRLIEQSVLNYRQIAARTGVSTGTISNWTRDGGWKRPPFAPRACDTMPTARASAKLKRRMLGARLDALAERHVRELEASGCVDPVKLGEALELLNMARLAAQPRRRPKRRPGEIAPEEASRPIGQLCVGGVDLARAPRAAVEDFLANREPPPKPVGPRGRGTRRWREQARMREKER